MSGPLEGIRIVDLSVMISGPLAAMLLADQGAEVVKVEQPGLGDLMRYLGSNRNGMGALFAGCNRGKRSVVLDVKSSDGKAALDALLDDADVVIQNFRPGAVSRLGIGYDDVAARNPGVVYVSISGFGADGPYAGKRVYDHVVQGHSGFADVQTDPSSGEPALIRSLVCDKVTAYTAAQAITAALFARERDAARWGQHIELAMLDATVAFLWPDAAMDVALLEDDVVRRPTIGSGYRPMRLADGFVTVGAVSDSEFQGFARALGRDDVADDPRFATMALRAANAAELGACGLGQSAKSITVGDFLAACARHDVPAAPIVRLADLPDDPQCIANDLFTVVDHPVAGRLREVRPAPRFSRTPARISSPAPTLGSDTGTL
ncbi:MAG TPA: CoA transferase [Acidimicrobiales bacterium]|nr:CoA transferase [Acidimicrobiales bacterium]